MAASKSHQKAVNKYIAKAYDRIYLTVPKGKKVAIQAHTAILGQSVNAFINRAIVNQREQDGAGGPQEAAGAAARGGVVFLPSEAVKAAQEAAERTGETVAAFVARAIEETMERDGGDPGASESSAGHE